MPNSHVKGVELLSGLRMGNFFLCDAQENMPPWQCNYLLDRLVSELGGDYVKVNSVIVPEKDRSALIIS